MELIKNLKHMCRICAVNIKKRRSHNSAVSIFDTSQLVEKLKKYLNMDIIHNDELPKSICSVCYKKVEAIHALAALAKKTENFLVDFIKIAQNNLKETQSTSYQSHFQNEFGSFALLANDSDDFYYGTDPINNVLSSDTDIRPLDIRNIEEKSKDSDEVVLNFTLNDPLTKNIQKKIVVAKQKQNIQNILKRSNSTGSYSNNKNEEIELSSLKPNSDTGEFIREINNSLEQKRQNLKMILNNSNIQSSQRSSDTNNYKVILPPSSQTSASINQHSINVAVQIQQPTFYPQRQEPPNTNYSSLFCGPQPSILSNFQSSSDNNQEPQYINDSLNLGSVIKDMDLLKLILKALKWPFNQDTLPMQIQCLKNTRFRDVMIDSNLLQDTDLIQILSSYLSPILLQQQVQLPTALLPPALSDSASNILPPSVSYKIPAETSVRLVSVPREETQSQKEPQKLEHHQHRRETKSKKSKSYHHYHRRHYHCSSYQYQQQQQLKRLMTQSQPPIIVLSDDEEVEKEVPTDPISLNRSTNEYQSNIDSNSGTKNIVESNFPLNLLQQGSLNSEVTIQKRKKQKRKQSLSRIQLHKNFNDQEIVIIDEHGEQPFKLSNEVSVLTKPKSSTPSPSKKSVTNLPPAKLKFDFLIPPKKKRKLHHLKSCGQTNLSMAQFSKNIVKSISKDELNKCEGAPTPGLVLQKRNESDKIPLPKSVKNNAEVIKNLNEDFIRNEQTESKPQIVSVQIINNPDVEKLEKDLSPEDIPTDSKIETAPDDINDESSDKLIIDENYDEKIKEEEECGSNLNDFDFNTKKQPAILDLVVEENNIVTESAIEVDNENLEDNISIKEVIEESISDSEVVTEKINQHIEQSEKSEKLKENDSEKLEKVNYSKKSTEDSQTPRRTTRQTKETGKPLNKRECANKRQQSSSPESKNVLSRVKTRHQEGNSKIQTRNSNVSQRGREHKPSLKYNSSSTSTRKRS